MSVKPRILFVSHAASRNGATILLLEELRWLRKHTDYELDILVNGAGELLPEFQAIGRTTVWRDPDRFLKVLPWNAARERIRAQYLELLTTWRSYAVIYLNTSAVASCIPLLARRTEKVIWHIHELDYALRMTMDEQRARQAFALTDRFLAVSDSVRAVLTGSYGVPSQNIDLVHGFVPLPEITRENAERRRNEIRRKFGWSENAFVVGGCGMLGWRKGSDLFLQIAQTLQQCPGRAEVRFLWVGGHALGDEAIRFKHDIAKLGLSTVCQLVPTTAEVMDYYHAMDVFALTSREDPFPLVMLEAGVRGLPTVCFAGSGGGPEFVGEDAGLVAPYLDVPAFAGQLQRLHDDHALFRKVGAAAEEKVRNYHLVEVQAPKVLACIQRCLEVGETNLSRQKHEAFQ